MVSMFQCITFIVSETISFSAVLGSNIFQFYFILFSSTFILRYFSYPLSFCFFAFATCFHVLQLVKKNPSHVQVALTSKCKNILNENFTVLSIGQHSVEGLTGRNMGCIPLCRQGRLLETGKRCRYTHMIAYICVQVILSSLLSICHFLLFAIIFVPKYFFPI